MCIWINLFMEEMLFAVCDFTYCVEVNAESRLRLCVMFAPNAVTVSVSGVRASWSVVQTAYKYVTWFQFAVWIHVADRTWGVFFFFFFLVPHPFSRPYTKTGMKMERGVHVIAFFSLYLAQFSCFFLPLRLRFSSEQPVLRHPQSLLFPWYDRSAF